MRHWRTIQLVVLAILGLGMAGSAQSFSCTPGPYIIFFESGTAFVDENGMEILDNARHGAGGCGSTRPIISGHTDTREDKKLAQKRVDVVRAYFEAHGIPRSDIVTTALAASRPRVPTERNVSERQNRRVEIIFGPS
jgi:OOP family OmpA-OmpF porin